MVKSLGYREEMRITERILRRKKEKSYKKIKLQNRM